MPEISVRRFYDDLAATFHLLYPEWETAIEEQARVLDALIVESLGAGPWVILDAACGIGTQVLGLARRGHRGVGTDLSPPAAARAGAEARLRGLHLPTAAADMRALPFRPALFDV